MLRPATPLTVLLFAAFVLLLVSVVSTPIIKQIPLATFGGVNFGVFGFCQGSKCSPFEIGYNTANLFSDAQAASFDLPTSARTTLSAILIVHPIAALFTLVMLILAASAHFHSPSHSPRYLLGIFILSILTLILALLAFLIDVLLFVPHMAWGSYIVLAATILIAASGIVSCAMRRTLVSRKARKRRIAENAEMNGENFYNRQAATAPPPVGASSTLVSGGLAADNLPAFATFEEPKKEVDRTSDERIPLTTRTPSENSRNAAGGPMGMNDRFGGPGNGSPPRDQYGNPLPLPQPGAYGSRSRDPSIDPSINRQYSDTSMNSRGRGMPPGGYRGRGGYPPGGRGNGYGPRGGYGPPRGGYGQPRGGFGPPPGPYRGGLNDGMGPMAAGALGGMPAGAMMRGGRGGLPPGYGQGRGGYDRGPPDGGSYGPYGRRPYPQEPTPGYGRDGPPGPNSAGGYGAYNPEAPRDSLPRAESPPPLSGFESEGPVGRAIEMDATTGSPSHPPRGFGQFGVRDSDQDVAGMVGLQQQRNMIGRSEVMSDGSKYSSDEPYVPPRAGWAEPGRSSPLRKTPQPSALANVSAPGSNHKRTNSGDNYYEDVDPRFAEQPQIPAPLTIAPPAPGGYGNGNLQPHGLDGNSYDEFQSGSRSPAESERSNFTSVSQRGVNPRWVPAQPGYGPPMPTRRPVNAPQQRDLVLNSNPDFELPGGRGQRSGSAQGGRMPGQIPGMVPNSSYPGGGAL